MADPNADLTELWMVLEITVTDPQGNTSDLSFTYVMNSWREKPDILKLLDEYFGSWSWQSKFNIKRVLPVYLDD